MANGNQLPDGFVLDQPAGLPEGFVLDPPGQAARAPGGVLNPPVSEPQSVSDVLGIGASENETRATQELPELGSGGLLAGEDYGTIAKLTPVLLMTTSPDEMANIITSTLPHIGRQEDEKGNIILGNNKTGVQVVVNQPGLSKLDILQGLGIATAFTPSAKLASIPTSIPARMAVGGAGAGLTEAAIQGSQAATGGEFDVEDVGLATGLGAVAEGVMPAIQGVRQSRRAKQLGAAADEFDDVAGNVAEAQAASKATGVPLFQAQQTAVPAQLEKQSFVGLLPAGTRKASQALRKQNKAVSNAVDDFLSKIAPDEAVVTGPAKFRSAAQRAVDAKSTIRSEAASPLYKEAFKQGAKVDLKPVNNLIKQGLDDFPDGGEVSKNLLKISKLLKGKDGAPTLNKLHNAKLEIDQALNKFGDNSLGTTTKREVAKIKDALLKQMDDSSDLYKQARETFAANSPAVNQIEDSVIGKIANLDDTQLKSISRRIFDPAETNRVVIRQAKKVISDIDPDAWNELLRSELERRMGSVTSTLTEGTTENIPGQMFRAIFGNAKQRAVLYNAVDGDAKSNLKYLETALSRARLGRPGGSQTATREEIKKELRGGVTQSIRNFFSSPIKSVTGVGEDVVFNRRTKAMADVLFDPEWKPQMTKLKKLSPDSPAALRAMTQLLNDAEQQQEAQ